MRVFLSHNAANKDFVRRVAIALRDHGLEPWLDVWKIKVGDALMDVLEKEIRACQCFVLFWSHESKTAPYVEWERQYAARLTGKRRICVRLDDLVPPPEQARHIWLDWLNWRDETTFDESLAKLLRAVRGKPQEDPPPAPQRAAKRGLRLQKPAPALFERSYEGHKQSNQRRMLTRRIAVGITGAAALISLALFAYSQTESYQINRILSNAPVQALIENNDSASQSVVCLYLQALTLSGKSEIAHHIAQQIPTAPFKNNALIAIAQAQTEAGQWAAERPPPPPPGPAPLPPPAVLTAPFKNNALIAIVQAQTKAGQWAAAERITQQIQDAPFKNNALIAIVQAQTEAGQWAAAKRTTQQIQDAMLKAHVLDWIARVQAEAGQRAAAKRTAQQIQDATAKVKALDSIARVQAEAGQWAAAERITQQIQDATAKAYVLDWIARVQAKAGQWAAAERTTQQIQDAYFKTNALIAIAQAQAKAGQWAAAERITQQIQDGYAKAQALGSIAQAQAKAGQWAAAERTTQQIQDATAKAKALGSIVQAQVEAGQWAAAERTTQQIQDATAKAKALGSIVQAQAKAGQWKIARYTAESASSPKSRLDLDSIILIEYAKSKNPRLKKQLGVMGWQGNHIWRFSPGIVEWQIG